MSVNPADFDIEPYIGERRRRRPIALLSEIFYRPVEIVPTPTFQALATHAMEMLLNDGFTTDEAAESTGLHIYAATAFANTGETQDDLQQSIMNTSGAPPLGTAEANEMTTIDPGEAIEIAPFLAAVTPFAFDMEAWLTQAVANTGWDMTRPALRWLELWHDRVTQDVVHDVITQCVETEGGVGINSVALYSDKLERIFNDASSEFLDSLLSRVQPYQTLPLFGELGPNVPGIATILPHIRDEEAVQSDAVHAVRHVNHFADDCGEMDTGHLATLFGQHHVVPEAFGDFVLVSVGGVLVGSIKMLGHNSMVALRTIEDSSGKQPLVIGGVYTPRQEIVDLAESAFDEKGGGVQIDVDELAVRPLRFLNVETAEGMANLGPIVTRLKNVRRELETKSK